MLDLPCTIFPLYFTKIILKRAISLTAEMQVVGLKFDKQHLPENRKLLFNLYLGSSLRCQLSLRLAIFKRVQN